MRLRLAFAALLVASPVFAASYDAELDPVPFDAVNRADVIDSIGNVTATLDGATLTVKGTFTNLASPAKSGSFRIGLAKGVPGEAIGGALTVTHAQAGTIEGSATLTPAQIEALNRQALYIRIDSEKAPDGNIQGWLEGK
jgi:hypothetical protein